MLRLPKSSVGWLARKAVAVLLAYCFFATSVWSAALPGEGFAGGKAGGFISFWALRQLVSNKPLAAAVSKYYKSLASNTSAATPAAAALTNSAMKAPLAMLQASGGATATVNFFGPQEFVRTTGNPNTYTVTVQVPSWVTNPFNLHIQSGEADGTNRVSSATVLINNVQVAGTADFNQNVFTIDRAVTLTPTTTLTVTLASKPGSYLRINLSGANADHTAPVLTIVDPATSTAINTPQAHLDIHYQDLPGAGEPAASGVNINTLQVLLDGVDRTSLFTKRSDEATADLPASLALAAGPHTLAASIQDNAGNTAHATSNFQVDLTPPSLQILQPIAGAYLNTTSPQIQLAYGDNVAVNTASLKVTLNGVDVTAQFSKTATGATANLSGLAQGPNNIIATISDTAGNQTTASVAFNVDTTPPTIIILHPEAGSRHGSSTVEFSIQFSDDQAIDPASLRISMDGNPLTGTTTLTSASGSTTLADGTHTLTASIKDKAGNPASASSSFLVDTQLPTIHIEQPAPGAVLNNPKPQIQVQYSDPDGINTSTFKITIDGGDVTSSFAVTATSATAALQTALADGAHTIVASVADLTGNVGQTSNTILIDTIAPQITILAPLGPVNTLNPSASAHYSDSGSGIDPTSLHVFSDGTDVTSSFSVSNTGTAGVLTGLTEGTHQFRVTAADKAGNIGDVKSSFLVDVTPPQANFASPANNAFINNPQPNVVLNYTDSGAGVDVSSIHIFLQPLNGAETEITSGFTIGAAQATGTISTALTPGTYHLRAQVADKAGNLANPDAAFALDTTPPTYIIQTPAANAFLKTATPTFVVTYEDDSSGVDPAQFALRVDGVDRTNRITTAATGASGTLQATDALPDGIHQVDVTVIDRAGNQAPIVPQPFLVDTTPPTIVIATPVGSSYTKNNVLPIAITYSDSGSGIDVTTFHLAIDGVDQTSAFTVTATAANGTPVSALPDGLHTITATISDLAGNPSTATATFTVDTVPPQVIITQPANGFFTNAGSVIVSGSVTDASPVTVTVNGAPVSLQGNSFTTTVTTQGTDGNQSITVVATDAAGNATTVTPQVGIDRTAPTITSSINPVPNAAGWNNTPVTVSFICADTESGVATCSNPVQLPNEGANQTVTGTALDKAGNTATATVIVNIDKTPPVITGTPAPVANAASWNTTDVTITYACTDALSGVVSCPAQQVVSTEGKAQQIAASTTDKAGNTATTTLVLNIEKTGPTITASVAPAPNAGGWNNTDVTVNFVCTPSVSDVLSCQSPITISTEGKNQNVSGTVTDTAGKTATASATVNIDKTPPLISATAAPPANAAGWNNTNVVISYLCSDSLSGIALCPPPTTVSAEGAAQKINAQAVDQAGNASTVTTTLNIDKTPPVVTATAAPPANGAGWNNTNVTVSYSCTDTLSGVASCPSQTVVATEGQNQNISGQATDVAGNVATGSISLSIDKTPPTIVQLTTPDHISRLHGGQASVTVNDNFTVTQVVLSMNSTVLGTFTAPPYQADLAVPAGSNPGDTLTITAVAKDEAGNTQTSSRGVRVAADGVIVGQVLSDTTSFPIQGASVQSLGTTSASDQTDDHGRYSLQASDSHLFLTVTSAAPATTTVEREIFVQEGVGTVPVDARLTPLAQPTAIGSAGGSLTAGNVTITVPSGVVGDGTSFQLTQLSGQGLPGLLPLGWSPLAAFDLRASSSAMNLPAAIGQLPNTVLHLVTYNPALHAWTMVTPNLQAVSGAVTTMVPSPGDYALVTTDTVTPPIPVPNPGDPLVGIDMQLLNPTASSSGSLSPAILPPTGGTSTATLGVQTTAAVPSGTVIQANISEKFSLKSGDVASEESRAEDIVLYNALAPTNSTLGAQFAVTPSRKYTNAQLLTGKVHLDILAGREGVRGQPGGSNPLTLSDGVATLSVPGGALNQDTAISLQSISLEDFVPTNGTLSPVQEVLVDFSGDTLNAPAQLSVSSSGLNPADTYLLTMVQRIDGVPHMVMAALAQINGASLTSVASPGLPGITQGGEYVFYDIAAPVGFVQGTVSSSAGPVQALVQTDSLSIVSITGANGSYFVPALAGSANINASSPHTNLIGSASVQVTAGQTAQANITLSGAVTNAVVSPADGTLGVPASTTVTITTTAPLNPQSIVQSNLALLKGTAQSGTPVALQPFVLSSSGTVLSLAPVSNLDPATQYTVVVTGLADTFGGAVVVPTSSFTTKAVVALNVDPNAITFSFPDDNGNIQVSAPAGSLKPGTTIMIVDLGNGTVLSLTAFNDGSVSGNFQGTTNDVLQVTVTDPNGSTTTFTRSQFVAPDGRVAIGPGGGTVTGPGGVQLDIPDGAVTQAVTFKIAPFDNTKFSDTPPLPGANFSGGMEITVDRPTTFNKEVKVTFAKPPDAPDGAFYYVYRRLQGPNGAFAYETIDHAFVQGTGTDAKVVTASPPFPGLINTNGTYHLDAAGGIVLGGALLTDLFLAWSFSPALPGIPLPGIVTGKVLRPQFLPLQPGQVTPQIQFVGVPGVTVSAADTSGRPLFDLGLGTTQADGKFVLWAPFFHTGDTINLVACDNQGGDGTCHTATAFEVTVVDTNTIDTAGPLLKFYRNVAFANINFAPLPPKNPPPQLQIDLFQTDQNGFLSPARGPFLTGTTLVVKVTSNSTSGNPINIAGATLQGQTYGLRTNPDDPVNSKFMDPDIQLTTGGVYTVTATALPSLGGNPVTASTTFLVVKAGGSNNTVTKDPPNIDESQLVPKNNAIGVPTNIDPQVVFTEPVNNVASNVSLLETDSSGASDGPSVNIKVSGVGVIFDSQGIPTSVALDTVGDHDNVTAITIQPLDTLKYNTWYKVKLTGGISDLTKDVNGNPAPQFLVNPPRQYVFQTFGPTELATVDSFFSPRIVILQNRAYYSVPISSLTQIKDYDVSDPVHPQPGAVSAFVLGRIQDLAGEETFSGNSFSGPLLAAGTGAGPIALPSNIYFFDASDPNTLKRVGAMSVTGSANQEGTILHMTMKDTFAYTTTLFKGIQVVDINQAMAEYNSVFSTNPTQFGVQASTEGEGFARDAVINTIQVMTTAFGSPVPAALYGIAAADMPLDQNTQTIVVATGIESLAVADPIGGQLLAQSTQLQAPNGTMKQGFRVALGNLSVPCPTSALTNPNNCNIAAIIGRDLSFESMLMIVDLNNPRNPIPVGAFSMPQGQGAFDVVIQGNLALVSTTDNTLIIDLADPSRPSQIGSIDGIGGTLTLNGFLFGTTGGGTSGLHIASLGALAYIKSFDPKFIEVSASGELFSDVKINYGIVPPISDITTAEVHIDALGGTRAKTLQGPVAGGSGTVTWQSGSTIDTRFTYLGTVHAQFNGAELPTVAAKVPLVRYPIAVQSKDRMVRIQVALPDQQLFKDQNGNPIDKYTVKVFLNGNASGSPAFQVTSTDIANAYVNTDVWFNVNPDGSGGQIQDGSDQASRPWVTRKIDMFAEAVGVPNPVRMQAYEIGTILSNLSSITVVIFSETQQKNLKLANFNLTPDNQWAGVISDINDTVNPGTTCNAGDTCANSGLLFRLAHILQSVASQYGSAWVRGFLDGWTFAYHNSLLLHPINSIFGLLKGVVELTIALFKIAFKIVKFAFSPSQWGSIFTNVTNAWRAARNAAPYVLDLAPLLPSLAGYAFGYFAGFAVWMVLELLATGALTEGIGAIADAVIDAIEVPTWIVQITTEIADTFEIAIVAIDRFFLVATEEGELALVTETEFQTIFVEITEESTEIRAVFTGYKFSSPMLEAFGEMFVRITNLTEALLKPVFETLLKIPIMIERAGAAYFRLIPTLFGREALSISATAQLLETWVNTLHLALGIKDVLEQIVGSSDAEDKSALLKTWPIGAMEAAFIAAQNTDPSEQVIKRLALAYGGDTGNVLFTLKPVSQDTTYTDQTITETIRLLVDSTVNLPNFSSDPSPTGKNAVAGLAKMIQAECSLP